MTITESKIAGKLSQAACEDGIVTTADFAAVIDGSTSKTRVHYSPDMKNGRLCMLIISDYIRQMPAEFTMQDFCNGVSAYIRSYYLQHDINIDNLEAHPELRLTASTIVYSETRREVWMVGDCQCIIDGKKYDNSKPYEQRIAEKRVEYIRNGMTPEEARSMIVPDLIMAMRLQNRKYAVIDGFNIYMPGCKCIPADKEIVMASDGYPFLKPTLAESEKKLEQQLVDDPQCINTFIATKGLVAGNKSFDDRAYLKMII